MGVKRLHHLIELSGKSDLAITLVISILRTNAETLPLFVPRYGGKSFVSVLQCFVVVLHISCSSDLFISCFTDN